MDSEYQIINESFPKANNKIITKIVKGKEGKGQKKKRYKKVVVNYKVQYSTKNSSVFMEKTDEILKNGDLAVDNINSTYIGRHIIRNGDRPQNIIRSLPPMSEFYCLNQPLFDNNEIYVDKSVTMSGCFKSNKETLQRTMIPDLKCQASGRPTIQSIKIFEKAIKNCIRKLKISEVSNCFIEDLDLISFNKNTYPGFHLYEYFGHKNKEEASFDAMEIAKVRWKKIDELARTRQKIERNKIFPNTFVVGARNKRDYLYEDDEILTSRAIHMPEFYSEINSLIWIEQVNLYLKSVERGPLYIGNSIFKYDRLVRDLENKKKCIEGDWKRFDSRLYITNIIIGIAIIRLYFPLDDERIDYHFIAMFDTIGIKDYYTPGGYLYRMIHGLPSGICSTSILGSIINLVNLLYCTQDIPSKFLNFIVGGDDFLIGVDEKFKNFSPTNLNKIEERANEIGQVFKFITIKDLDSKSVVERPSFFKYTIDENEPIVFPPSILERVFLPWNKKYNSNFKIFNFLHDLIPCLGSPRSCHLPFYYFYSSVLGKVTNSKISPSEILKLHKTLYQKIISGERYYLKDKIVYFRNFSHIFMNNPKTLRMISENVLLRKGCKIKKIKITF